MSDEEHQNLLCELGFRLGKPSSIIEIIDQQQEKSFPYAALINNAIFYLIEIGCYQTAQKKIKKVLSSAKEDTVEFLHLHFQLSEAVLSAHLESLVNGVHTFLRRLPSTPSQHILRCALHLMELALKKGQTEYVFVLYDALISLDFNDSEIKQLECLRVWALLQEQKFDLSQTLFDSFSSYDINQADSLLNFLYGCQLAGNKDTDLAMLHFSNCPDRAHPKSFNLGSYHISGKLQRNKKWADRAFFWEKRALFRELYLYHSCIGENEQAKFYLKQEQKQYFCLSD